MTFCLWACQINHFCFKTYKFFWQLSHAKKKILSMSRVYLFMMLYASLSHKKDHHLWKSKRYLSPRCFIFYFFTSKFWIFLKKKEKNLQLSQTRTVWTLSGGPFVRNFWCSAKRMETFGQAVSCHSFKMNIGHLYVPLEGFIYFTMT